MLQNLDLFACMWIYIYGMTTLQIVRSSWGRLELSRYSQLRPFESLVGQRAAVGFFVAQSRSEAAALDPADKHRT